MPQFGSSFDASKPLLLLVHKNQLSVDVMPSLRRRRPRQPMPEERPRVEEWKAQYLLGNPIPWVKTKEDVEYDERLATFKAETAVHPQPADMDMDEEFQDAVHEAAAEEHDARERAWQEEYDRISALRNGESIKRWLGGIGQRTILSAPSCRSRGHGKAYFKIPIK